MDEGKLAWLRKHRTSNCPNHGGVIQDSLVKGTFYCPKCKTVWYVRRNQWSWKVHWYYHHEQQSSKSPA